MMLMRVETEQRGWTYYYCDRGSRALLSWSEDDARSMDRALGHHRREVCRYRYFDFSRRGAVGTEEDRWRQGPPVELNLSLEKGRAADNL